MAIRVVPFGIFLMLSLSFGAAHGESRNTPQVYGGRPGYLFNVKEEKNKRDLEMVLIEKPKPYRAPLDQVIFDQRLTREFQQQYEYRFGVTQAQQVMNSPGRFDEYTYYNATNVSVQEYQKYQRNFAEYMGRRLTEHHVDQWAKKDPDIRPIYEFKDKISNINMEVRKGYKLHWRYSFSGNYMDFRLDNPYDIYTKLTLQMNQAGFGPSSPDEIVYEVSYPVSKRLRLSALHRQEDGLYQLVGSRQMTASLSTTVTASVDDRREGPTVQQNLFLIGLSWND